MSIFGSILEKLGIQKPAAPPAPVAPVISAPPPGLSHLTPTAPMPSMPSIPAAPAMPGYTPPQYDPLSSISTTSPAAPVEMPMVDVVSHLDYLAKTGPIKGLNWRMSINDLMALLGLDHSPEAIKALAVELGCPEKEMGDSYSRNVWTHTELLRKIAANGGNIPPELLK